MKSLLLSLFAVLVLLGCDAKTGANANMPDVALYPGAKVVTNGENGGIIGANLMIEGATVQQVTDFYSKELGVSPAAGAIKGTKNGHDVSVIVTDAGQGKTAVVITQTK